MDTTELAFRIVTALIAAIALTVSIFSWRSSKTALRLTIKNSYMTALFEIDKQMISNPTLWAVYDNKKNILTNAEDPIEKVKRRSFIFYHFNLFEITHTNYSQVLNKDRVDKEFWESMLKYIKQFFRDSTEARETFKDADTKQLYLSDFIKMIDDIISDIETNNQQESKNKQNLSQHAALK